MPRQIAKIYHAQSIKLDEHINKDLEEHQDWEIKSIKFYNRNKGTPEFNEIMCIVIYNVLPQFIYNISPQLNNTNEPNTHNSCDGCIMNKSLKDGEIILGDSPCQWCYKNPFRLTSKLT